MLARGAFSGGKRNTRGHRFEERERKGGPYAFEEFTSRDLPALRQYNAHNAKEIDGKSGQKLQSFFSAETANGASKLTPTSARDH